MISSGMCVGERRGQVYGASNGLCPQVPEQDETYAEDSFVVEGSEVEELGSSEEEGSGEDELILEESVLEGRRMYPTRRRARLRRTRAGEGERDPLPQPARKTKPSRIIRQDDSSEEEQVEIGRMNGVICRPVQMTPFRPPKGVSSSSLGKASLRHRGAEEMSLEERCRRRLNPQVAVSKALDVLMQSSTRVEPTQPQVRGTPCAVEPYSRTGVLEDSKWVWAQDRFTVMGLGEWVLIGVPLQPYMWLEVLL